LCPPNDRAVQRIERVKGAVPASEYITGAAPRWTTRDLVCAVADYLAHKRALGRKVRAEENSLELLVATDVLVESLRQAGERRGRRK
jgi:hypothetical protein